MKKLFAFFSFVLTTQSVFADFACDTDISKYYTLYEIDAYTCSSGQYLPANIDGCRACPTGFTCNGGTFEFNPDIFQGLNVFSMSGVQMNNVCAANFPDKLYLEYEPNSHTCSLGYYLPAGVDVCTPCPTGGNCSGGTFTFNETTNQGVDSCNTGYYKDNGTCVANTITVRWDDGNGGAYTTTCTYGGALTTPTTEPVAPRGYHFTGWTFNLGN